MPRQTRFKGLLAKPIKFQGCPPSDDEGYEAFEKFWQDVEAFEARETETRLRCLYEMYGVRYGASEELLYLMAFDAVPGFRFEFSSKGNKGGHPLEWTADRLENLARDVDGVRMTGPNVLRRSIKGACQYIAESPEFPRWHPPKDRALAKWVKGLRDRYAEGRRLLEARNA